MNEKSTQIVKNKSIRWALMIAGTLFLAIGLIGIVIPVLPTTPFLLLAAACYARSSIKFYTWLIENKIFGQYIKDYRENNGIPMKIKLLSVVFLWVTIALSIFLIDDFLIRVFLLLIAMAVTVHIFSIKTLHNVPK